MQETFDIAIVWWKPVLCTLVIAMLPGAIAFGALKAVHDPSASMWAIICTAVAVPLLLVVVAQMLAVKLTFSDQGLRVGGGVYSATVPYGAIDVDGILLAAQGGGPKLELRTNGIGLPGLALGWFQSARGKVFAVVAEPRKSVYIPTTLGFDILVSPDKPDAFVEAIRRRSRV